MFQWVQAMVMEKDYTTSQQLFVHNQLLVTANILGNKSGWERGMKRSNLN